MCRKIRYTPDHKVGVEATGDDDDDDELLLLLLLLGTVSAAPSSLFDVVPTISLVGGNRRLYVTITNTCNRITKQTNTMSVLCR